MQPFKVALKKCEFYTSKRKKKKGGFVPFEILGLKVLGAEVCAGFVEVSGGLLTTFG